ncbi:asparagine--tRNA ligase, cytoplasmic 3-like [Cryptomeria japonica]|uniref:asparagine--tRNA ligase, cytoplasmic 3-like n=1 Tax=Cryptomeria japonica TaxID=3369 RepID=UPI0027DA2732|nr:asparagine--tRNA ligase, cytoplasmic 3-like [Cryptomeria japonica]
MQAWVKTGREQGKTSFAFLEVNDANCPPNVQARIPLCLRSLMRLVTGANNNSADATTDGVAARLNSIKSSGNTKTEPTPGRTLSSVAYLQVSDGSCATTLQVVVDSSMANLKELTPSGSSIVVEGVLKEIPDATKKKVELKVQKILHVGTADPAKYPITKTRLPLEFLRNYVHLRPRTNTISSVARIRNALAYATHTFFQNHGFIYVHTPIITTSHCENAGEAFQVTTLYSEADRLERELKALHHPTEADIQAAKDAVKQKTEDLQELKKNNSDKASIDNALEELNKAKAFLSKLEETTKLKPGLLQKDGKFDYSIDFFSRQAYLTVSGQLHVESFAHGLSSVYTFGPTFRAEISPSRRHLVEHWMVEPEIAFADLEDAMNCAEDLLKFLCQWLVDNCMDDMKFMANQFDKILFDRLRLVTSNSFERITYTEAVDILKKNVKFESTIEWGMDFNVDQERFLVEEVFKKPMIVYNHPKQIKSFSMRLNDDGVTVASMDVLVPKVGVLMSGSQREERYEVLEKRLNELGLPLGHRAFSDCHAILQQNQIFTFHKH